MTFNIVINPGSGPVNGTSLENARANIQVFVQDLHDQPDIESVELLEKPVTEDNGRYAFYLRINGSEFETEVEMPGLALENVRYLGLEGQNIWDFPRLYVDGSSWIWKYALGVCAPDDDDE